MQETLWVCRKIQSAEPQVKLLHSGRRIYEILDATGNEVSSSRSGPLAQQAEVTQLCAGSQGTGSISLLPSCHHSHFKPLIQSLMKAAACLCAELWSWVLGGLRVELMHPCCPELLHIDSSWSGLINSPSSTYLLWADHLHSHFSISILNSETKLDKQAQPWLPVPLHHNTTEAAEPGNPTPEGLNPCCNIAVVVC